jgi:hypothetical protein
MVVSMTFHSMVSADPVTQHKSVDPEFSSLARFIFLNKFDVTFTFTGCGMAQLVVCRFAIRRARVRILTRHPREVSATELFCDV